MKQSCPQQCVGGGLLLETRLLLLGMILFILTAIFIDSIQKAAATSDTAVPTTDTFTLSEPDRTCPGDPLF